jgi:methionyl-tRNA synthetase
MKNTYYLTTPIYYVNDKPHIGHAYSTIAADAFARFHRLKGESVFFISGTDENSQKNVQAMEKAGGSDLSAYLDEMSSTWRKTWSDLNITLDDFIRTTEPRHLAGVERFWNAVKASGDLYEGTYEGLYCGGCEGFKTETDLENGQCPLHPHRELDRISEKNYFFRLSAYRDALLALYDEASEFVMPEARRHEIRNYVADHMTDISVSREAKSVPVGIPVPGDDSQRIYVWFDALLNYLTVAGYGTDDAAFQNHWPADLHLVGKDILKFHCALWPAMIMSAAKNDPLLAGKDGKALLPKRVFAHGFFTMDGQKISKSLGNAIDPREVATTYGFDAVRYYLLREIPFGEDGDFSRTRLAERYDSDLANTFGNLVQRTVAMSRKYFDGKVPTLDVDTTKEAEGKTTWMGAQGLEDVRRVVEVAYADERADIALEAIWQGTPRGLSGLIQANKYIEETQPFKLVKEDEAAVARVLYALLEACRWYAWLVSPVMPETAEKVWGTLGLDVKEERSKGWEKALVWGGLPPGTILPEPQPLFPRIEQT